MANETKTELLKMTTADLAERLAIAGTGGDKLEAVRGCESLDDVFGLPDSVKAARTAGNKFVAEMDFSGFWEGTLHKAWRILTGQTPNVPNRGGKKRMKDAKANHVSMARFRAWKAQREATRMAKEAEAHARKLEREAAQSEVVGVA